MAPWSNLHRPASRNRRITGAVAAVVVVTLAVGVGLASQRRLSAAPLPTRPLPTAQTHARSTAAPETPDPTSGTTRQPEPARRPHSKPLGSSFGRLAYGINGDIYVADSDGRNRVRIANGAPPAARPVSEGWGPDTCGSYSGEGPIWSPDGRHLAYRGAVGRAGSCQGTVIISDPAGHRVASFPGEGWLISWSPDSTRVATWVLPRHTSGPTIGIYGLDGVRQALLTVPTGLMEPGDSDPVWSPDGASLVVPQGVQIPLDGSAPLVLPTNDPRTHYGAASSPDGSRIAWLHYGQPKGPVLVVAEPDGSQARVLTPGGVQGFKWSPTGDRIAFESQTRGARTVMGRPTELRIVNVATGTVTPLDGLGEASKLSVVKFSAEGDQILFSRTRANGGTSLWSVHADGSHPHLLVAGSDWGDWQSLSPTRSDPRLHGSATGRKK